MIRIDNNGSDLMDQNRRLGAIERFEESTVFNPSNPEHFMHIQPVGTLVEIYLVDELIARSEQAVWLQETGKSIYPPRIYLPKADVKKELLLLDKKTHCPLKGEARYHSYSGEEVAWSYDVPLDFAQTIKGLVSFVPERIRMTIGI